MSDEASNLELMMKFGGPFPWFGTYGGQAVAMLPAADLRSLEQSHHRDMAKPRRMRITRWERDPELAAFVRERLGKITQAEILAQIPARFGEARTPTKSSLSRFAVKWSLDRHRIAGGGDPSGLDGDPASTALKGRKSDPRRFDR